MGSIMKSIGKLLAAVLVVFASNLSFVLSFRFAVLAAAESSEATVTFQQGVNGYSGTVDTNLMEDSPDANWATAPSLTVDADEPPGSGRDAQGLVRFDNIIGTGPDQVPPNVPILSASLGLNTTNPGSGATLHRMVQTWADTDTWNSWGAGIQVDDVEAAATPDLNTGAVATGSTVLDVTASVQAWADGQAANHGWVFIPLGTDGWDFDASEGTSPPLLSVTYSTVPPPDSPAAPANLVATGEPGQIFLDWDDNSEPGLAGYNVYRSPDDVEYTLINADSAQQLDPTPITASTGEKPQSKAWLHDNQWWCVLADSSGTWLRRLDGDTWTSVLQLSSNTAAKADCKAAGDVTHIALVDGSSIQLASVEYVSGQPGTYQFWPTRPALVEIAPSGAVETATIDTDSIGRMWCAYAIASEVVVRYSDSPYDVWSGPVILETGLYSDDICMVTALPDDTVGGTVGILWSNQNTRRFGFRVHVDGDDAMIWSGDEVPASQSANDSVGLGMADDHLNTAVASDGTLYAAIKTSYDTAGYPKIALLVRRPGGTWDDLHEVDTAGTRAIVVLQETAGRLFVLYTSSEGYNDIVYRESPLTSIAFGERQTLITGGVNDVTSTKQNVTGEMLLLASSSSTASGILMTLSQSLDPLLSEFTDTTVSPGQTYYYFVRAFDSIGQESTDSNVVSAAATAPEAANLTVTAVSSSQIDLFWEDNASAEDGFSIERSLDDVTWVEIATVGSNVITYSDTGLTPFTTYLYRVLAIHGAEYSSVSNVASATTLEGNYPPVAIDDSVRTDRNIAVDIDVLANDSDPNPGDTLTVSSIPVDPNYGSAAIINGQIVLYTPNLDFSGEDTFTYEVTDGEAFATATVTVTVNGPPTAMDDTASTPLNLSVEIDVLANDTDGEGDTLSITNLADPPEGEGTVEISGNETVIYTPSPGFLGITSFTYKATDGSLVSNMATVTVTVTAAVPSAIFYDGFESGGFTEGGWATSGITQVKAEGVVGVYCARTNMTGRLEKAISTEGYRNIEVEYHRRTEGLDGGEFLFVEWSVNGTDWNLLESTADTAWASNSVSCGAGADNQSGFRLRFRSNADKNREYTYIDEVRIIGIASAPDTDPPVPDPMNWEVLPHATGETSISMMATTATDPSGVEYYFTCTAGGAHDSGWQDSPTYVDMGLSPETTYTYTVTARDKSAAQNMTAPSTEASATTLPLGNNLLHVNSVVLTYKKAGKNYFVTAAVEIRDETGAAVAGASVSGDWSGAATVTSSGITDATGTATLSLKVSDAGTYLFAVTDVVLDGYTYDPSQNNTALIETDVTIP